MKSLEYDFQITHNLVHGRYNRVIIIYPNGQMDVIYTKDVFNHYHYFMHYLQTNQLDHSELQALYQSGQRDVFLYVQMFLNSCQAIVILDPTILDDDPVYYQVHVYTPKVVTENQINQLSLNQEYFQNYEIFLQGGIEHVTLSHLDDSVRDWNIDEFYSASCYEEFLSRISNNLMNEERTR